MKSNFSFNIWFLILKILAKEKFLQNILHTFFSQNLSDIPMKNSVSINKKQYFQCYYIFNFFSLLSFGITLDSDKQTQSIAPHPIPQNGNIAVCRFSHKNRIKGKKMCCRNVFNFFSQYLKVIRASECINSLSGIKLWLIMHTPLSSEYILWPHYDNPIWAFLNRPFFTVVLRYRFNWCKCIQWDPWMRHISHILTDKLLKRDFICPRRDKMVPECEILSQFRGPV